MKNISILIVDDSKLINNSLSASLKNRGFDVVQAFDISSAKKIIVDTHFDYVLLDLELPDGAGEELLPSLELQKDTRVIILTTSRDKKRREKIFNFNIVIDYIIKERYFYDLELTIVQLIQRVSSNNSLTMLIVEDSTLMQEYLSTVLLKRGFKIISAINGKDALDIIKNKTVDGIILDLEMPVMDGSKLLNTIKKDKKNLLMPAMVVSGTNDLDKIARVIKMGANDFIRIPFSNEELILKIDKMMQDVKQQKQIKEQEIELEQYTKQLERKNKELEIANNKIKASHKSKSDFLSVMSHEIRTPLNAIIGFVQILRKDEEDEKKKKYLEIIDSSSYMLTNVINDILDLSKIESGNFTLEVVNFNPTKEFNLLYALFEQNSIAKGVNIINNISADLPQFLKSDILRIKQIVSNLLSNAIKFTPSSKDIELKIEFDESKSSLYIEVRDEGIGISENNIINITKAFTQADNTTARKYGGTGLGLSIVTNLLKLFNSTLKIESELHKGSKFSFELKVDLVEQNNLSKKENQEVEINFANKKILVAEDNKTNQMLIKILLDDMDIDVIIANDGIETENIFKKEKFDMILMDINMPNKNGIDAMLDIKKLNKFTPIIALTANATSGDKQKYIDFGFDDYLSKPIEMKNLIIVLNKYL